MTSVSLNFSSVMSNLLLFHSVWFSDKIGCFQGGMLCGFHFRHFLFHLQRFGLGLGYIFYHLNLYLMCSVFPLPFIFIILPHHTTCGILVPWPGIEPGPRQWKRWILTTGLPGNSCFKAFLKGFVRQVQSSLQSKVNFAPQLNNNFWVCYPKPMCYEHFHSGWWKQIIPAPYELLELSCLLLLVGSFSVLGTSLKCMCWSLLIITQLKTWGETLCRSLCSSHFCTALQSKLPSLPQTPSSLSSSQGDF